MGPEVTIRISADDMSAQEFLKLTERLSKLEKENQDLNKSFTESQEKYVQMRDRARNLGSEYVELNQKLKDVRQEMKDRLNDAITEGNQKVRELRTELRETNSALRTSEKEVKSLRNGMERLEKTVENQKKSIDGLKEANADLTQTIKDVKTEMKTQLDDAVEAINKKFVEQKAVVTDLKGELSDYKKEVARLSRSLDTLEDKFEKLEKNYDSMKDANNALSTSMKELTKRVKDLERANTRSTNKIEKLEERIKGLRAAKDNAKKATDELKESQRGFGGILGGNTDSAYLFLNAIFALSAGFRRVGDAGVRALQAITRTTLDLDRSREALITLTGSVETADARLEQLWALAQLPGITFESAVKAAQRFEAVGLAAEDADTLIRQVGNAVSLSGGNFRDLGEVLRQVAQSISRNKVQQEEFNVIFERAAAIAKDVTTQFGTIDPEQITAQLEAGGRTARDFWLELAGGALAQRARANQDSLANITSNLNNAFTLLKNTIGRTLVPTFRSVVNILTDLIKRFNEASTAQQQFVAFTLVTGTALAKTSGTALEMAGSLSQIVLGFKVTSLASKNATKEAVALADKLRDQHKTLGAARRALRGYSSAQLVAAGATEATRGAALGMLGATGALVAKIAGAAGLIVLLGIVAKTIYDMVRAARAGKRALEQFDQAISNVQNINDYTTALQQYIGELRKIATAQAERLGFESIDEALAFQASGFAGHSAKIRREFLKTIDTMETYQTTLDAIKLSGPDSIKEIEHAIQNLTIRMAPLKEEIQALEDEITRLEPMLSGPGRIIREEQAKLQRERAKVVADLKILERGQERLNELLKEAKKEVADVTVETENYALSLIKVQHALALVNRQFAMADDIDALRRLADERIKLIDKVLATELRALEESDKSDKEKEALRADLQLKASRDRLKVEDDTNQRIQQMREEDDADVRQRNQDKIEAERQLSADLLAAAEYERDEQKRLLDIELEEYRHTRKERLKLYADYVEAVEVYNQIYLADLQVRNMTEMARDLETKKLLKESERDLNDYRMRLADQEGDVRLKIIQEQSKNDKKKAEEDKKFAKETAEAQLKAEQKRLDDIDKEVDKAIKKRRERTKNYWEWVVNRGQEAIDGINFHRQQAEDRRLQGEKAFMEREKEALERRIEAYEFFYNQLRSLQFSSVSAFITSLAEATAEYVAQLQIRLAADAAYLAQKQALEAGATSTAALGTGLGAFAAGLANPLALAAIGASIGFGIYQSIQARNTQNRATQERESTRLRTFHDPVNDMMARRAGEKFAQGAMERQNSRRNARDYIRNFNEGAQTVQATAAAPADDRPIVIKLQMNDKTVQELFVRANVMDGQGRLVGRRQRR